MKKHPAYMTHLQQFMFKWSEFIEFLSSTESVTECDFIRYVWNDSFFCWPYISLKNLKDACLTCHLYKNNLCYIESETKGFLTSEICDACKNNNIEKALKLSKMFMMNVSQVFPGWEETTVSLVTNPRTKPVEYGLAVRNGEII